MFTKNLTTSSDLLGALSSGLCLIHCLVTPFIFVVQSCSTSCCSDAPIAWSMIDYIFIAISFFAVLWSTKLTSKNWMKYALRIAWTASFLTIINEKFLLFSLPTPGFYIPALSLVALHLYNRRYCQCSNESCCVEE